MSLDRRRFLQLTALGIITVAEPGCDPWDDLSRETDHPQLLMMMLGPQRVRELGRQYLVTTPSEENSSLLYRNIRESSARFGRGRWFGYRAIDDQIRDDFTEGRTVLVDGWVLSVTEARQAALYSLRPVSPAI
ncbi:MAG TPA: hypothetical protein VN797_09435 [Gemmatimonadaceae bacterium]|nr:hypothetical protein [Gemmatimonadaceae bacterium]